MGAHAAPAMRVTPSHRMTTGDQFTYLVFLVYLVLSSHVVISYGADADALLKFKASLQDAGALSNWNLSSPPCSDNTANWDGVLCSKGAIWGLQLEKMELKGSIDIDSLIELEHLRSISLSNNNFDSPFPNINKLGALKSVYLARNHFSGKIPDDAFANMFSLKKLYLQKNRFTGTIPLSLTTLPKLMDLHLEDNQFEGKIPEFQQKKFHSFNVSNNALEGPIPASLSQIDKNAFSGNKDLCGQPYAACKSTTKTPVLSIVIIVIVVVLALLAIGAVILILQRRNQTALSIESPPANLKKKVTSGQLGTVEDQESSTHSSGSGSGSGNGNGRKVENAKLSFLREDGDRFDLSDLLRASAEILGSGCFGSSYKAAIPTGAVMVVKRFKKMNNVGKEEFQEHMRRLGRLGHTNLLSLVAYYYRKEEKLLVTNFVERGSLAVYLHGNRSLGQPSLDWPTRLKIVKGVARGLAYLYNDLPSLITPHGHLKSSNVLLDGSFEPILSDYGLVPVINQESAQELMVAYKSPEYLQYGRITKKTDVWSLGILMLEILTGQLPANFFKQGKGDVDGNLTSWVNSVRQNSTCAAEEVFDKDMVGASNGGGGSEGEMFKLLEIGLSCCEADVDKRLDIKEALHKIEQVRE